MIRSIRNKIKRLPAWVFWTGLGIIGLLIIIFNDAFGDNEPFIVFGLFYFLLLAFLVVKGIFKQIKSVIELKRDKAKMEMLHLKSQVNPHFFFNTLNNLYGLVEKDPQEAQALILKLSDLMRYSIYEGQNEWVSLEEEVNYLNNYVELHKNRYHKSVKISFNTAIHEEGYKIMPLMLILLVENAFKHGVEKLRDDAFVNIDLIAGEGQIDFTITNNYDLQEQDESTSGIGITNLKRRLEIGYQKDFDLSLTNQSDIYSAQIILYRV